MKIIFCDSCFDVFRLTRDERVCSCGKSGGKYVDEINAEIFGRAIPVGFSNYSFAQALNNRPKEGKGKTFEAFVIPEHCPTIKERK